MQVTQLLHRGGRHGPDNTEETGVVALQPSNELLVVNDGGVELQTEVAGSVPSQKLLNGGEHFDDVTQEDIPCNRQSAVRHSC